MIRRERSKKKNNKKNSLYNGNKYTKMDPFDLIGFYLSSRNIVS